MRPAPSQIWFEAASRIARQEIISFTDNQRYVLEFLWESYRELYMGIPDQVYSKDDILELSRLLSQKSSTTDKKERFDFLARGFEKGNLTLQGWDVALGPVYIKINREENFACQERFRPHDRAESLLNELVFALEAPPPVTHQACIGQILLSAILLSGLLNRKWLKPIQQSLHHRQIFQEGELIWIEMLNLSPEVELSKLSQEDIAQSPAFRLHLDHLTRLLVYRYHRLRDRLPAQKLKDPWDNITAYFKEAKLSQNALPCSLTELINSAFARYLRILPPSLVAYAAGKLPATSLPIGPLLRTVSGKSLPLTRSVNNISADTPGKKPKIVLNTTINKSEQERLLSELLKTLRFNKKSSNKLKVLASNRSKNNRKVSPSRARVIISKFLSENRGELSVTFQLLLHWAIRLLTEKSSHLERRKKQKIRTTSVDSYLQSFGYVLLRVAGDFHLHRLDPGDLETIYALTADRINKKRYGILRLRQFHGYLEYFYKLPAMEWTDLLEAGGVITANVNANLISAQVYRLALNALGFGKEDLSRWQTLHIIALILLYRCGLRPSEAQALRLIDVQGVKHFEILIRNSIFNDTKTNNGIRRINLSKALTEEELDFFLKFYRKRQEENLLHGGGLLFTHPIQLKGLLSDAELFDPIRKVLKTITRDDSLLLYHLRHSCISWADAILQMERAQYNWKFPIDGPPENEAELVRGIFRTSARNEPWGRKDQYLLSMLAGHSSPEITHRHYCHLLDLTLHLHLNDPAYCVPVNFRTVMALTGLQRSMAFDLLQVENGVHGLRHVVENESKKFDYDLRHPLMKQAKPFQELPLQNNSSKINPWAKAIEPLSTDKRITSLGRSQKEWDLAANFYEAVRILAQDGRKLKTARKVISYAHSHYNERWGGITFFTKTAAKEFLEFVELCNINRSQVFVLLHTSKGQDIKSIEQDKQQWIDALALSLNQIDTGEHAPVKSKMRTLISVKVTSQDQIIINKRGPRHRRGFTLAVELLATALNETLD